MPADVPAVNPKGNWGSVWVMTEDSLLNGWAIQSPYHVKIGIGSDGNEAPHNCVDLSCDQILQLVRALLNMHATIKDRLEKLN